MYEHYTKVIVQTLGKLYKISLVFVGSFNELPLCLQRPRHCNFPSATRFLVRGDIRYVRGPVNKRATRPKMERVLRRPRLDDLRSRSVVAVTAKDTEVVP
jgi:hypothetical protein